MKTAAKIAATVVAKFGIIFLCLMLVLHGNITSDGINSLFNHKNKSVKDTKVVTNTPVSKSELNSEWGDSCIKGMKQYEYGKMLLSEPGKEAYEQIKTAIFNVEPEVTFTSSATFNEIKTAYQYIYYDHSELFYLDRIKLRVTGFGKHTYTIKLSYLYNGNKNTIEEMEEKVGTSALKMLSKLKGKNDEEKEKELHDAIINNCDYDTPALDNPDGSPESFSVFGVFVNKKAVCNGYAQALKLLLNTEGIKALYVTGKSGTTDHAWNMVCVDDEWRYLDATFDDPVYTYGGQDVDYHTISYSYFNFMSDPEHVLALFDPDPPDYNFSENYSKMPEVD